MRCNIQGCTDTELRSFVGAGGRQSICKECCDRYTGFVWDEGKRQSNNPLKPTGKGRGGSKRKTKAA